MTNTIMSAGIISNLYNSRGLITHNFDNKALIRSSDGVLWGVIAEGNNKQNLPYPSLSLCQVHSQHPVTGLII